MSKQPKMSLAVNRKGVAASLGMSVPSINVAWAVIDTDSVKHRIYQSAPGAAVMYIYDFFEMTKFLSRVCSKRFDAETLRAQSFEVRAV